MRSGGSIAEPRAWRHAAARSASFADQRGTLRIGGGLRRKAREQAPGESQQGNYRDSRIRKRLQSALGKAGITLDGVNPWDPQIRNQRLFRRLVFHGTLGAGEAYVDGDWECARLDELSARLLTSGIDEQWDASPAISPGKLVARLMNRQSRLLARLNVKAHYDLGNDLFEAMLGQTMAYTCGYWRAARTLDEAQEAKHELTCRKLQL